MATYKTPGVYVEEISTLPPSVAEVSTAVPAFIGYTANGPTPDSSTNKVTPVVKRINTLPDYEALFGDSKPATFTVNTTTNLDGTTSIAITRTSDDKYSLYYSLSLYFKNGGGSCYIVSVGNYSTTPNKQHFLDGLAVLEKEDEPTLIVVPDAISLGDDDYYKEVCLAALRQCDKLGDRFAILDVTSSGVDTFRSKLDSGPYLMYGAAYYPFVQTTLTYDYTDDLVTVQSATGTWKKTFGTNGIQVNYIGASGDAPKAKVVVGDLGFSIAGKVLTINVPAGKTGADVADAWTTWKTTNNTMGFDVVKSGDGTGTVDAAAQVALDNQSSPSQKLSDIKSSQTALYNQIKSALGQQRITLPPSGAIAGVYASVDRDRGVWKAPANVGLAAVIGPTVKITQVEQDQMNIDPTAGKSVNAIRAFTGKGTLVWGARTLAGNDNEWRYVSVRRLFNMIEESTQKATSFAVFEPNDATTWLKVKAMIESYLYGLWQQGALAGATPDDAYFVNVGLGKTMTPQNVLEGLMNVEIGIAAVRPAEFIVLKFSHKLQQA